MPQFNPAMVDLLNKCEPSQRIMLHCMPSRIIRVVATDDTYRSFRVEQLQITTRDRLNPRGTWSLLSTHMGQVEMESYEPALVAAFEAQNKLIASLRRRQLQRAQRVP